MTTVVVTENGIAHDARGSNGSGTILADNIGKSIGFKGDVYIGVGSSATFLGVMYWIITGKAHPRWTLKPEGIVVVSRHTGELEVLSIQVNKEGKMSLDVTPIIVTPVAFGSGSNWAMAALDLGKTEVEAVEYAMTRDSCSGGEVTFLPRFRAEPIPDYNLDWINGGKLKTMSLISKEQHGIADDGNYDYSVEDLSSPDLTNVIFNMPPLFYAEKLYLNRVSSFVRSLADRVMGPIEQIKEGWAFNVEGKISDLSKYGNRVDYVNLLNMEFYRPMGLVVPLIPYIETLTKALEEVEDVPVVIATLHKYVKICIGDVDYITHNNDKLVKLETPDSAQSRKLLASVIDPNLTNIRCKINQLVSRNGEWKEVESDFNALSKRFNQLPLKELPLQTKYLANDVVALAELLEESGEIKSILGSENFKTLVSKLERIALAVDVIGVIGFQLQQLETTLLQNADLLKKA